MKKQLRAYGFKCTKCEWTGMHPTESKEITHDGPAEVITWKFCCPLCKKNVIEIE